MLVVANCQRASSLVIWGPADYAPRRGAHVVPAPPVGGTRPDYLRTGGISPPMIQKIGIGMPIRNMIQWPCLIDLMPRNRNTSTYSRANAPMPPAEIARRRYESSHQVMLLLVGGVQAPNHHGHRPRRPTVWRRGGPAPGEDRRRRIGSDPGGSRRGADRRGRAHGGPGPAEASRAPERPGLVLLALILVAAVANLNLAVANVALPDIGKAFDASQTALDLVAVGFSLGLASSVLYLGALGDRYGRKMMLLAGTLLAIPASIIAATASNIGILIGARLLGGLAAGMAFPTTLALITALWSGPARTRSIALWSGIGGAISALGRCSRGRCSSTTHGARSSCSRSRSRSSRWCSRSC